MERRLGQGQNNETHGQNCKNILWSNSHKILLVEWVKKKDIY
jgi:hypothetical protein